MLFVFYVPYPLWSICFAVVSWALDDSSASLKDSCWVDTARQICSAPLELPDGLEHARRISCRHRALRVAAVRINGRSFLHVGVWCTLRLVVLRQEPLNSEGRCPLHTWTSHSLTFILFMFCFSITAPQHASVCVARTLFRCSVSRVWAAVKRAVQAQKAHRIPFASLLDVFIVLVERVREPVEATRTLVTRILYETADDTMSILQDGPEWA